MLQKKWIIGVIAVVVVGFAFWQVSNIMTSAEPLTAEEATNKVKELYNGEIVDVAEDKNTYFITIELDTGTYEIEIDRESGEIGSMTRTQITAGKDQTPDDAQQGEPKEEPSQGDQPSTSNDAEQQKEESPSIPAKPETEIPNPITEAQAITIALGQVSGEVDDVEVASSGGQTFYLVEIEREDDEATVRIDAITGEVISIYWDD